MQMEFHSRPLTPFCTVACWLLHSRFHSFLVVQALFALRIFHVTSRPPKKKGTKNSQRNKKFISLNATQMRHKTFSACDILQRVPFVLLLTPPPLPLLPHSLSLSSRTMCCTVSSVRECAFIMYNRGIEGVAQLPTSSCAISGVPKADETKNTRRKY